MKETILQSEGGLSEKEIRGALEQAIAQQKERLKKALLIPPDLTRMHSGAGMITAMLYDMLHDSCQVDILPALGTHEPMTDAELELFFGSEIPKSRFLVHNWRTDVMRLGEVPAEYVAEVSEGLVRDAIPVEVNRRLLDPSYDSIISIGQVVPHEVVGMANYSKNILVGCGGKGAIDASHMLGAVYGMERMMGRDHTPVRKVFDYAETHFLSRLPLRYALTVTTEHGGKVDILGLFIGRERNVFEQAAALSQKKNLTVLEEAIPKAVVFLDEKEFKSTWLGNKAIYRTRMAIADGGELVILAPGVTKFGEDKNNDALIRKYGYAGRDKVLALSQTNADLRDNLSVAAHLIHGSSDGRFSITYATAHLTRREVESAGFRHMEYAQACEMYPPAHLRDGWNTLPDGQRIFYISNPALGLWGTRERFQL